MNNKKTRLIALLLATNLLAFGAAPTIFAAGDETGDATNVSQQVNKSYKLCTELVGERTVKAYLQLNAAAAERVFGYQITIRLTDPEGSVVPDRKAEFKFDSSLNGAKIKKDTFDAEKQLLQIYVADDEDLVQVDENDSQYTLLPIGNITVATVNDDEEDPVNGFRVLLDGPTGNVALAYFDYVQYDLEAIEEIDENTGERKIISPISVQGEAYCVPEQKPEPDDPPEEPEKPLKYKVAVGEYAEIVGYDDKSVEVDPRSVVTVRFKSDKENVKFTCWKDENGNVMSQNSSYTFAVVNNVKLTAVVDASEEITASVSLKGSVTTLTNGKYRLSYIGNCVLPKGCKIKEHGIVYTNNDKATAEKNIDKFEIGKGDDSFKVAQSKVSGTNVQFIANVNSVAKEQTRTARAYMIYTDGVKDYTVYSDPFQLSTK